MPNDRRACLFLGLVTIGLAVLLPACPKRKEDRPRAIATSAPGPRRAAPAEIEDTRATVPPSTASAPTGYSDCDEDNRQIYLVTDHLDLYRFLPLKKKVLRIGRLDCGARQAFSMAVDRHGTAWVLDNDGRIYKASTHDASCTRTAFRPRQRGGSGVFGMAFVSEGAGSEKESLFVADSAFEDTTASRGIATVDTATLELRAFMPFGGKGGRFELTGMGDGRMFGFDPGGAVPRIVQIDPKTGRIESEKKVTGIPGGGAWAMAQHWGDLYLFSSASSGHTQVTKFRYEKAESEVVLKDLGFSVVGAGISTCAASSREVPEGEVRSPARSP